MDTITFKWINGEDDQDLTPPEAIKERNKRIIEALYALNTLDKKNVLTQSEQKQYDLLNMELNVLLADKNKIDYQGLQKSTQIGFAEFWGGRDKQEDRLCVGQVPNFVELTHEERLYALKKTTETLEQTLIEKHLNQHQGSTLCAVIIAEHQIYTVNVGDSTAFFVHIDATQRVSVKRLNQELHHPTTQKESARLQAAGKKVIAGRIAGVLALSRAMGDERFVHEGLSHEPDIYQDAVEIKQGETAYVVLACDGLTEDGAMTLKSIGELVAENHSKSADDMASLLASEAKERGSRDNISVIVIPLQHLNHFVPFAAVFDGHGGDDVSEELASLFEGTLKFVIKCILLER